MLQSMIEGGSCTIRSIWKHVSVSSHCNTALGIFYWMKSIMRRASNIATPEFSISHVRRPELTARDMIPGVLSYL